VARSKLHRLPRTRAIDLSVRRAPDEDMHAVGSLAPILDGCIGCIVINPDDSHYVARAVRDPGAIEVRLIPLG
jgi:hypothetical protein